jgi:hypothetical protein
MASPMDWDNNRDNRQKELHILRTLNEAKIILDYVPFTVRLQVPDATAVPAETFKECGLEGLKPSHFDYTNGLADLGAYINAFGDSGRAIMDYIIVRTGDVTGAPVAKAQSDVYVQAIQMAKALKDVHFSGETENSNQDFKRYYARLNNAANGFPMILEVLENSMGHPF